MSEDNERFPEVYSYGYVPNMREMRDMWMCLPKTEYGSPSDQYLRRTWKDFISWLKKRERMKERDRIIALLEANLLTHEHDIYVVWRDTLYPASLGEVIALINGEIEPVEGENK